MERMEHTIEQAAQVIQQARDAGAVYDDAGEPLSAAETIARALADAGLLTPAPLTEIRAENQFGETHRRWATDWERIEAHQ